MKTSWTRRQLLASGVGVIGGLRAAPDKKTVAANDVRMRIGDVLGHEDRIPCARARLVSASLSMKIHLIEAVILLGATALAQPPSHYDVYRATSPIVIDAQLDEPAWQEAPAVGAFHFNWWKQGAKEQTVAKMLWDDQNLYVAFYCHDRHISASRTKRHGAVAEDDCVEVFVSPNPQKVTNYYTFEINAIGAMLNWLKADWRNGPPQWEPEGLEYRTTFHGLLRKEESPDDDRWIMEMAIPFTNFSRDAVHVPPHHGDEWRLNLNRTGGVTDRQDSTWSPITSPDRGFHNPEAFGVVRFVHSTPPLEYGLIPPFPDKMNPFPVVADITEPEGPIFDGKGNLYFVNYTRTGAIGRKTPDGTVTVWSEPGGQANGLKVDKEGNVIVADFAGQRILRIHPDGKQVTVLADSFEGEKFRGPNDVCLDLAGSVYFTDSAGSSAERPIGCIYKVDRKGKVTRLVTGLAFPNGIAVSPDQKKLYFTESRRYRVSVVDLLPNGTAANLREIFHSPTPGLDGIAFDEFGRLWVTGAGFENVSVMTPDGELIRSIPAGGKYVTNLCFRNKSVYLTVQDRHSIHRIDVGVAGTAQWPAR